MANNLKMSNAAVNAEADALSDLLDNGYLRIYDGSQPANADTAVGAQTLLAECRFANPASGAAVAGVITFSTITSDTSINATGTATWFRALKSDGTSAVMDGSVGTSAADLVLNSVALQVGAQLDITSFTHTIPKS
jgi:hypothetical protein